MDENKKPIELKADISQELWKKLKDKWRDEQLVIWHELFDMVSYNYSLFDLFPKSGPASGDKSLDGELRNFEGYLRHKFTKTTAFITYGEALQKDQEIKNVYDLHKLDAAYKEELAHPIFKTLDKGFAGYMELFKISDDLAKKQEDPAYSEMKKAYDEKTIEHTYATWQPLAAAVGDVADAKGFGYNMMRMLIKPSMNIAKKILDLKSELSVPRLDKIVEHRA